MIVCIVSGLRLFVVVRSFVMIARIRMHVVFMTMVSFLMGMIDHDGSPDVSDGTIKHRQ